MYVQQEINDQTLGFKHDKIALKGLRDFVYDNFLLLGIKLFFFYDHLQIVRYFFDNILGIMEGKIKNDCCKHAKYPHICCRRK